jgi:hypothetical protein
MLSSLLPALADDFFLGLALQPFVERFEGGRIDTDSG